MLRIPLALITLAVACTVLATDYRLSVNAPADQLAKAKALRVLGAKFEKGDRIVSVVRGTGPNASGLQVTLESGIPSGTVLAEKHTASGFDGKVILGSGPAPERAASAGLEKVPTLAMPPSGFAETAKSFASSMPGFITFVGLALLVGGAFLFRPRSSKRETWSLPNRRKSIDESLKDITRRLEQIDENQRDLVKKPPVLRTFKGQIDHFDARLKQLEGQLNSLQGLIIKTGGAFDRGHEDLKSRSQASAEAHKALADTVDANRTALGELAASLEQLGQSQSARTDEVLSGYGKQTLEIQSRLASLERSLQQAAEGDKELHLRTKDLAGQIDSLKTADETLLTSVAKVGETLSQVQSDVNRDVDLSAIHADIAGLREVAEAASAGQSGLDKKLDDLAAQDNGAAALQASLEELRQEFATLQEQQKADFAQIGTLVSELEGARAMKHEELAKELVRASQESKASLAEVAKNAEVAAGRDYDARITSLLDRQGLLEASLKGLGVKLVQLEIPSPAKELASLAMQQEKHAAALQDLAKKVTELSVAASQNTAGLESKIAGLGDKFATPAGELGELAERQALHADALQKLAAKLDELRSEANQSATGLESKIAEIGARTDQREAILLSLQNRVSDSDGKTGEASEVLPVIADLRLELQQLSADQHKFGAGLEGLSQAVSHLGVDAESKAQALSADQAKLSEALAAVKHSLDDLSLSGRSDASAPPVDESKLDALLAGLEGWKAGIEGRLSSGSSDREAPDDSKLAESLDALAAGLAQLKAEAEDSRKTLEERLSTQVASTPDHADFDYSKIEAMLESFSTSLSEWQNHAETNQKAFEERVIKEIAQFDLVAAELALRQREASEPADRALKSVEGSVEPGVAARRGQGIMAGPAPEVDVAASRGHEESVGTDLVLRKGEKGLAAGASELNEKPLETSLTDPADAEVAKPAAGRHHAPLVIDFDPDGAAEYLEASQESALSGQGAISSHQNDAIAESEDPPTLDDAEDQSGEGGWRLHGASHSRRWSAALECPISLTQSETPLTAMTPVVTPTTDYPVGAVLYFGKKILYAHGKSLRATWPGKGETAITLQQEMPTDGWRLAALEGHVFCVEEDQVELVSLASGHVVTRFSGVYVDQVCTDTHWVGLVASLDRLQLDYRNLQGRQLGEPVSLPYSAKDHGALAGDGKRVFAATRDARLFRVEAGEVTPFADEKEAAQLLSLSTYKGGVVVLARGKDNDLIRVYGFDGKLQRKLALDFRSGFDHPVLIGDRLYVVDTAGKKVAAFNLKKLEAVHSIALPGEQVSSFSGAFHGDQHALLITVGEKDHASQVLAIDAKTGTSRVLCDVKDQRIQVIAADTRIVVASSCFYQNMIRVFDPFSAGHLRKVA